MYASVLFTIYAILNYYATSIISVECKAIIRYAHCGWVASRQSNIPRKNDQQNLNSCNVKDKDKDIYWFKIQIYRLLHNLTKNIGYINIQTHIYQHLYKFKCKVKETLHAHWGIEKSYWQENKKQATVVKLRLSLADQSLRKLDTLIYIYIC